MLPDSTPDPRLAELGHDTRHLVLGALGLFAVIGLAIAGSSTGPRTSLADDVPPPPADLVALERLFAQVAEQAGPSVVGLRVERAVVLDAGDETAVTQFVIVNGTGCVVREDGLILTNEHVIQGARSVVAVFHDGTRSPASVVAADPRGDLAVLRVPREGLRPLPWCRWEEVQRGQWALALGNPYGLGGDGHACVSVGVISNLGRRLPGLGVGDDRYYANMIQTTAAIHPGHSGGPLLNARGELIGVITAVYTRAGTDEGLGFAIALTPARRRMIEVLLAGQPLEHGYLGLSLHEDGEEGGARVHEVEPGGPAARAGVQPGDLIVGCGEDAVGSAGALIELIGALPAGTTVPLMVVRGTERLALGVDVERRDAQRVAWLRDVPPAWLGLRVGDAAEPGVAVVDVQPDSAAARAGLRPGDVITHVSRLPVRTVDELRAAACAVGDGAAVTVAGRGPVELRP
jgi:serine protease Do